jgi:hypothetical protein
MIFFFFTKRRFVDDGLILASNTNFITVPEVEFFNGVLVFAFTFVWESNKNQYI